MEPLSWHHAFAIGAVGSLAYYDVRYRIAPNWLTLPWLVAGIITGGWPSLLFSALTFGMMELAQFPGGDCKGASAIAAWVPMPVFIPAFLVTLVVTIVIMESGWYNLYQRAHQWAWLAGFSLALTVSAICAMIRGT